ncbi:MAG: flavin reductase [Methylobacter sp.]|nr:flavin reductase [Methylobacter sp.]
MSSEKLESYKYNWPHFNPDEDTHWKKSDNSSHIRQLPEMKEELKLDSRWPGFFPSPICFVTTTNGEVVALEKVVGATIVNRFPYIIALSFCIEPLSKRHYPRNRFTEMIEKSGVVAIQYFEPGSYIDAAMTAINQVPDEEIEKRIAYSRLPIRKAMTNDSPVFKDAYMVYEARLAKTGKDFEGVPIFEQPYTDYGSHRIYYFEIEAIQLREDIAKGDSQISWQALPFWTPLNKLQDEIVQESQPLIDLKYQKGYSPNYFFPSGNTVSFEYDKIDNGMAVKFLPPLPEDQVEVDNDRARWPCFFPSSAGMITTWDSSGAPNLMPCGSTSILVRHPLCIGICVSYAEINVRYAPRGSLRALNKTKRFGCGVPFVNDSIIDAIRYAGNISIDKDKEKVQHAGLQVSAHEWSPVLPALPIHFFCEVVKVIRLGTHFLYLGEVKSIQVRDDVNLSNPMKWYPYPDVIRR